jgi:hypothetical protein
LLKLSQPITLSPTVQIVRLPNRRQVGQEFLNQLASVSGWGELLFYFFSPFFWKFEVVSKF